MDKILQIRQDYCGVLKNTRTSTKTQHLLSELHENTFQPMSNSIISVVANKVHPFTGCRKILDGKP